MTQEQRVLWAAIEAFQLDEADTPATFSARLARENRWDPAFTRRVIEEYKRFIFLGCAAGHPVSPSATVDQAWHLHLAYSKSYWQDLCGNVLKQRFHHQPGAGRKGEAEKFADWYGRTLASYREFFGEEPPADIWPPRPEHPRLAWVDLDRHWVVPKPNLRWMAAALGAVLILFGAGCEPKDTANVFDYPGPRFLAFYLWFSVGIFAAAFGVRKFLLAASGTRREEPGELGSYEVACLAGGKDLAANAALVLLVEGGELAVSSKREVTLLKPLRMDGRPPLERAILAACATADGTSLKAVRQQTRSAVDQIRTELERRGLVFDRSESASAYWAALWIAFLVPAVGGWKIAVGLSRGRPVGILVFLTAMTLFFALAVFGRRPYRTQAGSARLKTLRRANENLKYRTMAGMSALNGMLPMAVALYGLPVLEQTRHRELQQALQPAPGSSCGSGCGSSCGGDGGGGCGGCGGGD